MKKLITFERCLPGGGLLLIIGIRTITGGILVVDVRHYPAVVPLAA